MLFRSTNMRRMTIIVPDEVEEQLDLLKKEFYYAVSRSEMVRDLMGIGIQEKLRKLNSTPKIQKNEEE